MRVVDLEVLLHHFYRPEPYPDDSPAIREAHVTLIRENMIEEGMGQRVRNEHNNMYTNRNFTLTERGRVYVNALMSVPLPVQAWRIPIPDERKQEITQESRELNQGRDG